MRKYVVIICFLCSIAPAFAQDATYSADSLMATFEKSSNVSLKGKEITLTSTVIELRRSNIVFKSSSNDKVICDLSSPLNNVQPAVGQPLTVVGKVRGRGMLGNVTLDECSVASTALAANSPAVDQATHTVSEPAAPSEPVTEPAAADAQVEVPTALAATSPNQTLSGVIRKPGVNRDGGPFPETFPTRPEIPSIDTPSPATEPVVLPPPPKRSSSSSSVRPIVIGVVAIILLIVLVKAGGAVASRFGKPPELTVTEQVRRHALEQLLAEDRKKRWRRR